MLAVGGLPQPCKSVFAQSIPGLVLRPHDVEDLLPVLAARDVQLLDLLRCCPALGLTILELLLFEYNRPCLFENIHTVVVTREQRQDLAIGEV